MVLFEPAGITNFELMIYHVLMLLLAMALYVNSTNIKELRKTQNYLRWKVEKDE